MKHLPITLAVLLLSAASTGHAALIASNPWNNAASDAGAFSQANQQLASQFVLAAGANLNRATWHGTMFSADPLNTGDVWTFSINIYSYDGGTNLPNMLLNSVAVNASVTDNNFDVAGERDYEFDATFGDIALGAGNYYLSILNTGNQNTFRWTQGTGNVNAALSNNGINWFSWNETNRIPPNYMLYSNDGHKVPEPATLALVGAALLAMRLRRR